MLKIIRGGAARSSSTGNGGTWLTQYETAAQVFAGSRCSYSIEGTGFARVTNTTTTITIDCNLPIGTIIMWGKTANPCQTTTDSTHNRTSQFPKGWYVCNGSNGTPNLSDKFIKGTATLTSVGGTGGSHTKTLATTNLPSHSHTLNSHTHSYTHGHSVPSNGAHTHSYTHSHNASSNSTGAHTHTINSNTVNEGTTYSHSRTVGGGMHLHNISYAKGNISSINSTSYTLNQESSSSVTWFMSYLPGHDHGVRDFYMIPNKNETNSLTGGSGDTAIIENGAVGLSNITKRSQTDGGDRRHILYATHRTWIRGMTNNGQSTSPSLDSTPHTNINTTAPGLWYALGSSGVHTHNLVNTSHNHTCVSNGAHQHTITVNSGGGNTSSSGAHTHTIPSTIFTTGVASGNTGSVGSGTAFDIQPAYYQVVFIMRIS